MPFQICVVDAAGHASIGGKCNFFFDLNKQFKGYAFDLFSLVKELDDLKVKDCIGELAFPTGLEAVQLQAADLLCYRLYKYALKKIINRDAKPDELLRRLLRSLAVEADSFLDNHGLSVMLNGINVPQE